MYACRTCVTTGLVSISSSSVMGSTNCRNCLKIVDFPELPNIVCFYFVFCELFSLRIMRLCISHPRTVKNKSGQKFPKNQKKKIITGRFDNIWPAPSKSNFLRWDVWLFFDEERPAPIFYILLLLFVVNLFQFFFV